MRNETAERFADLEKQIAAEKGPFRLFALFSREDFPDRWDLIVSAPWVQGDRKPVLDYFVTKIKKRLGPEQLVSLARIVILDADNPAVDAVNRAMHVEHGIAEVQNSNFFGLDIPHAFIITSNREAKGRLKKRTGRAKKSRKRDKSKGGSA